MARNSSVVGTVKKGSYDYYKIRVDNPEAVIKLRLGVSTGLVMPMLAVGYLLTHAPFSGQKRGS